MNYIKLLLKKYKNKQCTVKEQMLVRIGICLACVVFLIVFDAIVDLLVWIYPYLDSIILIATVGVVVYQVLYVFLYFQVWAYGGVENGARKNYPYIQNALYMVVCDIYSALGVVKPQSKSAVMSNGQKTFSRGNWTIYQYNLLLKNSDEEINVADAKEILQKELVRKSTDGFDGITFDANGFPYLQVDSVLVDGAYLQVQMVVFWNEVDKNNYENEQEQKLTKHQNNVSIQDEVF